MARDPNVDRLIAALSTPPPPEDTPKVQASDFGKQLGSGALQAVGYGLEGVGQAINAPSNGNGQQPLVDASPITALGRRIAAKGTEVGKSVSPTAAQRMAASTPDGTFTDPSSWTLGSDPSVSGYALQAANVLGQVAPVAATALATRGRILPTAGVSAALGGGAAAGQEEDRINAMPAEQLATLPAYQDAIARGMSPAAARDRLASRAGQTAFAQTAPVSALSGLTEGLPITGQFQNALGKVVGTSRVARAVAGGVTDAIAEGSQEALENAAEISGANTATGEDRSLQEGGVQNAVLGAVGGAAVGTAGGLIHNGHGAPVSSDTPVAAPASAPGEAPAAPPKPAAVSAPYQAGAVNPLTGDINVAPGVNVNPNDGPLSKALGTGAVVGAMDRPAMVTMDDGSVVHGETGEVLTGPSEQIAQQREADAKQAKAAAKTAEAPAPSQTESSNELALDLPPAPAPGTAVENAPASPVANAEATPTPTPTVTEPDTTTASVPFFITMAQRAELRARGVDNDAIRRMTPAEAQQRLAQPAPVTADISGLNKRQLTAQALTVEQEQAKRIDLLGDEAKLTAYAADKGVSVDEMRATLQANHQVNTARLDQLNKALATAPDDPVKPVTSWKDVPANQQALDAAVAEAYAQRGVLDAQATGALAKRLGVTRQEVAEAKKRVSGTAPAEATPASATTYPTVIAANRARRAMADPNTFVVAQTGPKAYELRPVGAAESTSQENSNGNEEAKPVRREGGQQVGPNAGENAPGNERQAGSEEGGTAVQGGPAPDAGSATGSGGSGSDSGDAVAAVGEAGRGRGGADENARGGSGTETADLGRAVEDGRQGQAVADGGTGREDALQPTEVNESGELLDGDITTPSGSPFTIRDAAEKTAARHPGHSVVELEDGGYVVREGVRNEQAPANEEPVSGRAGPDGKASRANEGTEERAGASVSDGAVAGEPAGAVETPASSDKLPARGETPVATNPDEALAKARNGDPLAPKEQRLLARRKVIEKLDAAKLYSDISGASKSAATKAINAMETAKDRSGGVLKDGLRDVAAVIEAAQKAIPKGASASEQTVDGINAVMETLSKKKPKPKADAVPAPGKGEGVNENRADQPALFSKNTASTPTARTLDPERVTAQVTKITSAWKNAPLVRVVATAAELPAHIRVAAGFDASVEAAHENGAIYMIADRFSTPARVQQVLAHEAIGHYGVEQILGPQGFRNVRDQLIVARDAGRLKELFAEIDSRYGTLDNDTLASEALAVMAERGTRTPLLGRALNALRAFLRSLGFTITFSEGDLRHILANAGKWLESGRARPLVKLREEASFASGETSAGDPESNDSPFDEGWWASVPNRGDSAVVADARRQWAEKGTESPYFKEWFGNSQAKTKAGKPVTFYHATNGDFSVFDTTKAGTSTGYAASGLGIFLTPNQDTASRYGDRVMQLYVKAEKPYRMGVDELSSFETVGDARRRQQELAAQGYDSIFVPADKTLIAFGADQVKSATSNRGTFSAATPDINFSKYEKPAPEFVPDGKQTETKAFKEWFGESKVTNEDGTPKAVFHGSTANIESFKGPAYFSEDPTEASAYTFASRLAKREKALANSKYKTAKGAEKYAGQRVDYTGIVDDDNSVGKPFATDQGVVIRNADGTITAFTDLVGDKKTFNLQDMTIELKRGDGRKAARKLVTDYREHIDDRFPPGKGVNGNVTPVYLAIENPMEMHPHVANRFGARLGGTSEEWAATVADLEAKGYDGISTISDDPGAPYGTKQWIPLRPEQIKSAVGNNGAFSKADERITFSKNPAAALNDDIEKAAKFKVTDIVDTLRDKREDWRPNWLGMLTLRQLGEVAAPYLPKIGAYTDTVQTMQTRRNQLQESAAKTADKWWQWQRKNREAGQAMAEVMHDATLSGVDPAEPFRPGSVTLAGGITVPMTEAAVAKEVRSLEAKAANAPKQVKSLLQADITRLQEALAQEAGRRQAYPELKQRYDALPEGAKAIYTEVRDAYTERADAMQEALVQRIAGLELGEAARKDLTDRVRAHFESARVQAPYFPLARFGEYWVAAEKNGEKEFRMMENRAQQRRVQNAYAKEGWTTKAGAKLDMLQAVDGASASFMAQVTEKLNEANVDKDVTDEIYQLYLRTLPDLSVRKQFIHRKGVAGYDQDALRAFAGHMNHGAYQLSRLENSQVMETLLRTMRKDVEALSEGGGVEAVKAARAMSEVDKRHQWIMNPKDAAWVQRVSSANFAYYLGATPAAALVNVLQGAVTTFPALASKHGWVKALSALTSATNASIRTYGNIEKTLRNADERTAYEQLLAMGAIDRTLSHDLAGMGEGSLLSYNPAWRKTMGVLSHLFHKAEVFNREGAGLAAYRLSREAGETHEAAVKYAADTIFQTHFDYSNANRARFMQGNAAKVLFAFKQYSQSMTYYLWRNFYQATRGASPQERSEARKKLVGTLGMTAVFSGVLGLPLMTLSMQVANAMAAMFGDDDEPWDAETEFRNFLSDFLGPTFGRIAQVGPVQALTGLGIADRTKLDQMWFRPSDKELEGRAAYDYLLEQVAGPVGGMFANGYRAGQLYADGELWRGIETAMPKAVKDALKTIRYANEGVRTLSGDPLVPDLSPYQIAMQAAGFSPAEVSERYEANNAMKGYEQTLVKRRQSLLDAYAMATQTRDMEAVRAATEAIERFNRKNPEIGINASTIRRSLQSRQKYSQRMVDGLVLNPKLDARLRAAVSFDDQGE